MPGCGEISVKCHKFRTIEQGIENYLGHLFFGIENDFYFMYNGKAINPKRAIVDTEISKHWKEDLVIKAHFRLKGGS